MVTATCRQIITVQTQAATLPPRASQGKPEASMLTAEFKQPTFGPDRRGDALKPVSSGLLMSVHEMPLAADPQTFGPFRWLAHVPALLVVWRDPAPGWVLDIADASGTPARHPAGDGRGPAEIQVRRLRLCACIQ